MCSSCGSLGTCSQHAVCTRQQKRSLDMGRSRAAFAQVCVQLRPGCVVLTPVGLVLLFLLF
jgi:hypothetical protein